MQAANIAYHFQSGPGAGVVELRTFQGRPPTRYHRWRRQSLQTIEKMVSAVSDSLNFAVSTVVLIAAALIRLRISGFIYFLIFVVFNYERNIFVLRNGLVQKLVCIYAALSVLAKTASSIYFAVDTTASRSNFFLWQLLDVDRSDTVVEDILRLAPDIGVLLWCIITGWCTASWDRIDTSYTVPVNDEQRCSSQFLARLTACVGVAALVAACIVEPSLVCAPLFLGFIVFTVSGGKCCITLQRALQLATVYGSMLLLFWYLCQIFATSSGDGLLQWTGVRKFSSSKDGELDAAAMITFGSLAFMVICMSSIYHVLQHSRETS